MAATEDSAVRIRVLYGGTFYKCKNNEVKYRKGRKGCTKFLYDIDPDLISKPELEYMFKEKFGLSNIRELWYLAPGETIDKGLHKLVDDRSVLNMLGSVGKDKCLHIYVVEGVDPSPEQFRVVSEVQPIPSVASSHSVTNYLSQVQVMADVEDVQNEENTDGEGNDQVQPMSDREIGIDDGGFSLTESEDEDFNLYETEDEDDDLFDTYVDADVAELPTEETSSTPNVANGVSGGGTSVQPEGASEVPIDGIGNDVPGIDMRDLINEPDINDEGDLDAYVDSEDGSESQRRFPIFDPATDFKQLVVLKNGMLFESADILRKALQFLTVQAGGEFYFLRNDRKRISIKCSRKCHCPMEHSRKKCVCGTSKCNFFVNASKYADDGSFQVKSFDPIHECGRLSQISNVKSNWLAELCREKYRDDPNWKLSAFMSEILRDYKVEISYSQARRARMRAMLQIHGDSKAEYSKVNDYAYTILAKDPESSAFVLVESPEKPIFQRLYVCLTAWKKGFVKGCRPIIGLDGCHLRGAFTGQVLSAVGKDGNNNIFPIAYAVVEAERKETWMWFLQNLLQDVGECSPSFISDRQKGLVHALKDNGIPESRTRVCVRHMYNNFKKQWVGQAFKGLIWAAARACTKADFDRVMNRVKEIDEGAHQYLMKQDPITWSRHLFSPETKSDMLLNNICESFNAYILPARDMSILTMAEWIRRKIMRRFVTKREGMEKQVHLFTPNARKQLESAKTEGVQCRPWYSGGTTYEVDYQERRYLVDLQAKTCSCFKWELTGIPCSHAISAIFNRRLNVEDFVHPYYSKDMYLKAYEGVIPTMPGLKDLVESGQVSPLPPNYIVQPGRPKKNARRREPGEEPMSSNNPKAKRIRITQKRHCKNCGGEGHYKNTCSKAYNSQVSKPKGTAGRPTNHATMVLGSRRRKNITKDKRTQPAQEINSEPILRRSPRKSQDVSTSALGSQVVKSNIGAEPMLRKSPRKRGPNDTAELRSIPRK